jgi:hypothetical protein
MGGITPLLARQSASSGVLIHRYQRVGEVKRGTSALE